ncbi:sigma-70 family RNA polymerase sigma factor [Rathayibacter sp. VKM Ac-2754]|nr:sigma-70 family RNA polymerase sigma factor [Rathayibacter sp. VKM Ac-2754]
MRGFLGGVPGAGRGGDHVGLRAIALGGRTTVGSLGDSELIVLVRAGEGAATAELWRRHAAAARSVARAWSGSLDPDDLVSEAFVRVLSTIERGGGPDGAFRPYLFTAVRNVAASWGRRQDRERPLESDEDVVASEAGPEEAALAALDRDLGLRAFRSLPARWQEVLWYTEVEGLSPVEVAPLLGLRPNSVAALSHRAREGLRSAWIQEHVADVSAEGECRWVLERAGSHVRGRLPARDRLRMRSHLAECAECRAALTDAQRTGARLATVLLPLAAGIGGATAYATGGAAAGVSGGAGVAAGGVAASAGTAVGGVSAAVVAVAAGLVLVAGVAVAALLTSAGPQPSVVSEPQGAPPEQVASTPEPEATIAAVPAVAPTPTVEPQPPAASAPDLSAAQASPAPAPVTPVTVVPPPSPEPIATAPTPTPRVTSTPSPTPPATPTPTPTPSVTAPPVPTTATLTTDPDEHLLPDAAGTAAPGSTVTVEDAESGEVYADTVAGLDGQWSLPGLPLPAGETSVIVRTTAPDGTETVGAAETVRLLAPSVLAPATASAADGVPVVVLADPGPVQLLVDGDVVLEQTVVGLGLATVLDLGAGEHEIGARYASADGRVGATGSTTVVVR